MDITISAGSSALLAWPLVDPSGNPVNVAGQPITFTVYQNTYPNPTTVLTLTNGSGITVVGTGQNQVQVPLSAAQSSLPAYCRYELVVGGSVAVEGRIIATAAPNYTYSSQTVAVIQGPPGVGIASASVNAQGHLILVRTDGSSIDAGYLYGNLDDYSSESSSSSPSSHSSLSSLSSVSSSSSSSSSSS